VNTVPVLVLQHPAEALHAKGSARLLRLSLSDCQCVMGETFDPQALSPWLAPGAALLYPATPSAVPTAPPDTSPAPAVAVTAAAAAAPVRCLVVLDGTWRQSRHLLHLNPWLQALPRLPLHQPPPSQYRVRKAQRPEQRSTLEATCLALGHLEGRPAHYAQLLQGFADWVQALQGLHAAPLRA
jgi:DTW domain-containing protein YfiP